MIKIMESPTIVTQIPTNDSNIRASLRRFVMYPIDSLGYDKKAPHKPSHGLTGLCSVRIMKGTEGTSC